MLKSQGVGGGGWPTAFQCQPKAPLFWVFGFWGQGLTIIPSIFLVAYTAEEVQYNWLSGSEPVGLEGDLQMSQFDLQKTFARELNFTRHESGTL